MMQRPFCDPLLSGWNTSQSPEGPRPRGPGMHLSHTGILMRDRTSETFQLPVREDADPPDIPS